MANRLYQKKTGGTWYGWYYDAYGKQRSVCLKTKDKRAAQLALRRLEREAHASPGVSKDAAPRPLKHALAYLVEEGTAGRSAATVEMWASKAGHLLRLLGDVDINDPKLYEHVNTYINTRIDEGAAPSTIAKELATLRAALKLAHKRRLMLLNPAAVLPSFSAPYVPRDRYLTQAEFGRLLAQLGEERRLWVELAVYTGGRFSEIERLTWEDHVRLDAGWIVLPGSKTKKSRRTVPIPPPLMEALVASHRREGPVALPWKENVRRDLAAAAKRAGIDRITPNDLRRTYASWMKQAGVDSKAVADLLGHTTTRMVDLVYGHLDDAAYRRAVAVLPARPAPGSEWVVESGDSGRKLGRIRSDATPENAQEAVPRDRIELPTRGFSIGQGCANRREPSDLHGDRGEDDPGRGGSSLISPLSSHIDGASPRVRIVASIAQAMVAALDAADLEAARVAHEAIGRLLRENHCVGAGVVDLAARRWKR